MSGQPSTARSRDDKRVDQIRARMDELGQKFAANVAAATDAFARPLSEVELAGMLAPDRERARRRARARGLDGFLVTLDAPSFAAAVANLDDRALRKSIYEAHSTRASDRGPRAGLFDNTPVLSEILELRSELALAAGFRNYAELALSDGVLRDPDEVEARLVAHHRATKAEAQAELDVLWAFAKEKGAPRGFSPWDLPYYAARWIREKVHTVDDELKDFFPLSRVLAGALKLASELVGVSFLALPAAPDAYRYRVVSATGASIGLLAVEARGSAELLGDTRVSLREERKEGARLALVECDFEARWAEGRACLAHAETEALFHGIGEATYLLCTHATPTPSHEEQLGGEVAGAYLERFASHFDTLRELTRRGEAASELPRSLYERLTTTRRVLSRITAPQELELVLFDLRIHRDHVPAPKATQLRVQVLDTFTQIRREQSVLPASYWTRFANTASSIFAHGRAARLWERDFARAMAAELFAMTEANDRPADARTHLRRTLWARADRPLLDRLASALGHAAEFGKSR